MINTRPLGDLPPSQAPWLLFRVEHRDSPKLSAKDRIVHPSAPSHSEFSAHLSSTPNADSFISFVSTWDRAMQWRKRLESECWEDITVIVILSKYMAGLYDAKRAAFAMHYNDDEEEKDPHRRLRDHYDEYLIYGNLPNDEDRILVIFRGSGPDIPVTFECSYYSVSTTIPAELLPGDGLRSPLEVLEYEMYKRSGVLDGFWRDQLVKAIAAGPYPYMHIEYGRPQQLHGVGNGIQGSN